MGWEKLKIIFNGLQIPFDSSLAKSSQLTWWCLFVDWSCFIFSESQKNSFDFFVSWQSSTLVADSWRVWKCNLWDMVSEIIWFCTYIAHHVGATISNFHSMFKLLRDRPDLFFLKSICLTCLFSAHFLEFFCLRCSYLLILSAVMVDIGFPCICPAGLVGDPFHVGETWKLGNFGLFIRGWTGTFDWLTWYPVPFPLYHHVHSDLANFQVSAFASPHAKTWEGWLNFPDFWVSRFLYNLPMQKLGRLAGLSRFLTLWVSNFLCSDFLGFWLS